MKETEYYALAHACDSFLLQPDVNPARLANPFLHVVSEHPVHMAQYKALFQDLDIRTSDGIRTSFTLKEDIAAYRIGHKIRKGYNSLWAMIPYKNNNPVKILAGLKPVDVVIVSWLVNSGHLKEEDDFYFGPLQSILAERGLTSLLILGNQSGHPSRDMSDDAHRDGPCARYLLPDIMTIQKELETFWKCFQARKQLNKEMTVSSNSFRTMVGSHAAHMKLRYIASNLRMYFFLSDICRQAQQSIFIALYEGHAWERLAFKSARQTHKPSLCVGYQHTTMRRNAYAMRRSLYPNSDYDPDLILCLGEITCEELSSSSGLSSVPTTVYGSHRCPSDEKVVTGPNSKQAVLVLPEGLEEECVVLFEFGLECARRLPDVPFIFRTHPVLPYEKIKTRLNNVNPWPSNVEISRERNIERDYGRSRCLLYRGSSTALYAVLAGLKPFYVDRPGEMDIDPLFALKDWREHVGSAEELVEAYKKDIAQDIRYRLNGWEKGKEFCRKYVKPIQADAIDEMLKITQRISRVSRAN